MLKSHGIEKRRGACRPRGSTIAWNLMLRRHALLDAVDDGELGGAVLGFLEQALRLVEQAGVSQRDAHAARRASAAAARRRRCTRCSRSQFSR
jgi:hypothetical protein